jgi:DNA-binding winged helix-turn-helix (wHTH) protein/TolB-like protein
MRIPRTPIFYFEDFEADARARELYRRGTKIKVYGQPFEILIALLEHPGEVVTREELRVRLWPTNTFVDFERVLNTSIMRLRNALGDSAANPRFIETLPRVGYRFIAPVAAEEKEGVSRIVVTPEPASSSKTMGPGLEAAVVEGCAMNKVAGADGEVSTPTGVAMEYVSGRRLIHAALVGALAMVGIVFAGSFFGQVKKWDVSRKNFGNATVASDTATHPVIAILSFANLSGRPEEDWLSSAFAEMLATEMGAGATLRVVPTQAVKAPRSSAGNDQFAQELLQKVRTDSGADEVVLGSYTALGKEAGGLVRVDIHVRDTSSGEMRAELSATGSEAKLFSMVAQLGAQLRNKLGVRAVADDSAGLASGLAGTFKVVRLSSR